MQRRRNPDRTEHADKIRSKLDAYFTEGQFYEAQQLCQTLANRMIAQENYDEAAKLVLDVGRKLLEQKQGNAAGELLSLLFTCYEQAKTPLTPSILETLLQLFHAFPADTKAAAVTFMKDAIAWSAKVGKDTHGEPSLHHHLARYLSTTEVHPGDYPDAQRYWLFSHHPREFGQILYEWSQKGFPGERDLFIARPVLQYLCLENLGAANAVFDTYVSLSSANKAAPPLDSPLINFLRFLLKTVERDAAPLFHMLRQKYAFSIARDPTFTPYLDRIGELYFGIKAPKSMIDELMSMMKE